MSTTHPTSPQILSLETARQEVAQLVDSLNEAVPRAGHQVAAIFRTALETLVTAGAEEKEFLPLVWDVRLWSFHPREILTRSQSGEDLPALSERFGAWSNDLQFLPPASVTHFESRIQKANNPFLRARYADFLAVRATLDDTSPKDLARNWILQAVPSYLASVPLLRTSEDTMQVVEAIRCLDSAGHLALCKAPELLPDVVRELCGQLKVFAREKQQHGGQTVRVGRWALECGWILLNLRERKDTAVSDADVQWWQQEARSLALRNAPLNEPNLEQNFWSQSAEAARLRKQNAERLAALHEMARAKVNQARVRTQGKGASFLAGASILEDAVENLERLRDALPDEAARNAITEETRLLKLEIRRYYREGERELGVISTPVDISRETLEAAASPFLEPDNLTECLQRLGGSLLPEPQKAEEWAESRAKSDDLSSLFGTSLMSEGMEIRSYNSPEEKEKWEFNRMLDWQIQTYSGILLPIIWQRLRAEKGLTAETLLKYLDNWAL